MKIQAEGSVANVAFRDNLAKLRGLAGEKGYNLDRAPIRDCWFLVNEKAGKLAACDNGKTAGSRPGADCGN